MSLFYRALHVLRRCLWRVTRPVTLGVKVLIADKQQRIVLVRPSYDALWQLPGGGVKRNESFHAAARREVLEECGLNLQTLSLCQIFFSEREYKRDHIALFFAQIDAVPALTPSHKGEIADCRFFSLTDLPANLSPATRRRIAEYGSHDFASSDW